MTRTQEPTQKTRAVFRAEDRGTTEIGWLLGRHSFSFGRYQDPQRMSYRALRVLNDDIVKPGRGFSEHGHDNMEILTWVLQGELAHADSTGMRGTIKPGDLQMMSAGRGIRHSEKNASQSDPVHLLQIWIEPRVRDIEPRYAQTHFSSAGRANRWQHVAMPRDDGVAETEALQIEQDAHLHIADLAAGKSIEMSVSAGRYGYLHVAFGTVMIDDDTLNAGDALALTGPAALPLHAQADSQLLFFDLA